MTDPDMSRKNPSSKAKAPENRRDDPLPTEDRITQKDKVDVLMRKYALLKQEIINTDTAYKAHVRHFLLILPAAFALITLLTQSQTLLNSRRFWIALTYTAITIVSYVVFDLLESQYKIIALGARLRSLEKMINDIVGQRLLIWETSLANAFFGEPFQPSVEKPLSLRKKLNPKKLNPDVFLTFFLGIIVLFSVLAAPTYSAFQFWTNNQGYALQFKVLLVGGFLYAIGAMVLMALVIKGVLLEMRESAQRFALDEARKPLEPPDGDLGPD